MCEAEQAKVVRKNEETLLIDLGDGVGQIRFLSKGNSLSPVVRVFVRDVLEHDAYGFRGLVIANEGKYFSAGADLGAILDAMERGECGNPSVMSVFQETQQMIRDYHKPIVAAPFRNTLGGGLELCMHCHARVALRKLYMGLVEVNVGLLPTGGGLKEIALAAGRAQERESALLAGFERIMLRAVSKDAEEAKAMGYLAPSDRIVEEQTELLPAAKARCLELLASPATPVRTPEWAALGGRRDYLRLMARAGELLAEGTLSPHDLEVAKPIARVLAGSDTENDVTRTARELFILEARGMWELKQQAGTRARISHFLEHGAMLRN